MKQPWMKFYPSDWQADELLGSCGLAARGLWVEMMALMHKAEPYGHLLVNGKKPSDDQIAALARAPADLVRSTLLELESVGVFSRTRNGTIYSRRMTRDEKRRQEGKLSQQEGGPIPGSRRGRQTTGNTREKLPPPGLVGGVVDEPPSIQRLEARIQKENIKSDFDRFWEAWPDKTSPRKPARASFEKALKRGATIAEIMDGLSAYVIGKPDWAHWAHATTWLNQDRWTVRFEAPQALPAPFDPETSKWEARLYGYRENDAWNPQWGPEPGQPGCQVPPQLLIQPVAGVA